MKILITGCAGLIIFYLIKNYLKKIGRYKFVKIEEDLRLFFYKMVQKILQ